MSERSYHGLHLAPEMLMDADVIGLFWFCSVIFCNYSSRDILKQTRLKKNAI